MASENGEFPRTIEPFPPFSSIPIPGGRIFSPDDASFMARARKETGVVRDRLRQGDEWMTSRKPALRHRRLLLLLLLGGFCFGGTSPPPGSLSIEDFGGNEVGKFPKGWWARDARGKAYYRIRKEGGKNLYLRASVPGKAVQIVKRKKWDPRRYPLLRWRWRVKKLPKGGNERIPAHNDSAAGVYVGNVQSVIHFTSLKYVWSTTLPVGTRFRRDKTAYIVLRSGTKDLGKWVEETVDVAADYEELFGERPESFSGIGLLSDGDDTASHVEAHYDDFLLLPKETRIGGETPSPPPIE